MAQAGRLLAVATAAVLLSACWAIGYGPAVDRSRFVSAKINEAGVVLYTAHDLVYRPASGWRAYPDGGIPLYLTDRNVIGRVNTGSGRVDVLHRQENTEWQNGQGDLNIHDFKGNIAVITEGGQRRRDYLPDVHYYLLDLSRKSLTRLSVEKDLEARGRGLGYLYLLDERGTLLFVTPPFGSRKVETQTNEIWVRRPAGEYVLLAKGAEYYGEQAGEAIYWEMETRQQRAYDVATGSTRPLPRYVPLDVRPVVGVGPSSDGKRLELSRRQGDTWSVVKILLTADQAR